MKARSMTHPCFVSPLNSLVERKSEQKKTVEDSGKGKESALLKSIATDSNDIYFVIARALINEAERGQKKDQLYVRVFAIPTIFEFLRLQDR